MNNVYESWICLVVIMSRFSMIRHLIHDHPILLTGICSITAFGRTSNCIMGSLVCFIRILYLYDMSFVEETLGEKWVRLISHFTSYFTSCFILVLLIAKGEVVSGLLVLYTGEDREIIGNLLTILTITSIVVHAFSNYARL